MHGAKSMTRQSALMFGISYMLVLIGMRFVIWAQDFMVFHWNLVPLADFWMPHVYYC